MDGIVLKTEFTAEELAKLPKWAQGRIIQLERRVNEYKSQRDEIFAGINGRESNVYIDGYRTSPNIYLPNDSTVVWKTGEHNGFSVGFEYLGRGREFFSKKLIVRSTTDALLVRPQAANTITVDIDKR